MCHFIHRLTFLFIKPAKKLTDDDNLPVSTCICMVWTDPLRGEGQQFCFVFSPSKWRPHSEFYDFHILKLISHLYVASSIPLTVLPLEIRASCWCVFLVAHPPSISDVKSACLCTPPVWFSTHSPRGFPFAHWFWSPSYFRPFYLHLMHLLCLL